MNLNFEVTVPESDIQLPLCLNYSMSENVGCHAALLLNLTIQGRGTTPKVTERLVLYKAAKDIPAMASMNWYLQQNYPEILLEAACQTLDACAPAYSVIFTAPINLGSDYRGGGVATISTADIVNWLIVRKIGCVTSTPVLRNPSHGWTNPSFTQTWLWVPSRYVNDILPGTGRTYNAPAKGLFFSRPPEFANHTKQWRTKVDGFLSARSWKLYPHYRKIRAAAKRASAELDA